MCDVEGEEDTPYQAGTQCSGDLAKMAYQAGPPHALTHTPFNTFTHSIITTHPPHSNPHHHLLSPTPSPALSSTPSTCSVTYPPPPALSPTPPPTVTYPPPLTLSPTPIHLLCHLPPSTCSVTYPFHLLCHLPPSTCSVTYPPSPALSPTPIHLLCHLPLPPALSPTPSTCSVTYPSTCSVTYPPPPALSPTPSTCSVTYPHPPSLHSHINLHFHSHPPHLNIHPPHRHLHTQTNPTFTYSSSPSHLNPPRPSPSVSSLTSHPLFSLPPVLLPTGIHFTHHF
ncbi:hypothetical protein Pcinc_044211 [Petrolisthes cinctipes]|uniref:Uncharacterized protein n=1 Tax=Petrolisthes cinctipes TaxID=88211 RepID=A0AAE1BEK5_PETCI|nr:hypothetical protein Pcinc_044211 [Petrolisthes cinctipes]